MSSNVAFKLEVLGGMAFRWQCTQGPPHPLIPRAPW